MNPRKFEAIVVDDEPAAISTLENALLAYPELNILAHFTNPEEAFNAICRQHPDIVFLDIDMPGMTGIELLDKIHQTGFHSSVVFVTAFDKYAIEAIHRSAFDYLVKPINSKELEKVIIKFLNQPSEPVHEVQIQTSNT
jgi:two-component system LytT family response regulator